MLPLVFNGPVHHVSLYQLLVFLYEEINIASNIIIITFFIAFIGQLVLFCHAENHGQHRPSSPLPPANQVLLDSLAREIECYWIVNYHNLCCLPVPSKLFDFGACSFDLCGQSF